MEIREYLDGLKEIQQNVLNYIDQNEEIDNLIHVFTNQNLINDKIKTKEILKFISIISQHHHRTENFFNKIEKIIDYLQESIKKHLSNTEIFDTFKNNKKILLFMFEKEIISMNDQIVKIMTKNDYFIKAHYSQYFLPELKPFISNQSGCEIDIKEKRKTGFDDSKLCQLIQNDSLDQFIIFVNQTNLSLLSNIKPSFTETHSYLIDKNPTIIEYAAFFGSIQIFKYLILHNVELTQSLWIYAIHGRSTEILEILEENDKELENEFIDKCLIESIKCHHNEIVCYLIDNYSLIDKDYFTQYVKYFNLAFIEEYNFDESHFYDFCQFDYQYIVEKLLESNCIKINKIIKRKSIGYNALHIAIINENIEIVKTLLSRPEIDPNITNSIEGFGVKKSPLALAIQKENIEIIKLLLECKKVNVNLKCTQPWYGNETNALIMAIKNENIEIIKLLLEKEDIDVNCFKKTFTSIESCKQSFLNSYYDNKSALVISIEIKNIEIIKMLLNHPKIDVNLVCTKENLYKNNDWLNNKIFHPYYSKHLTKGFEYLYIRNHQKEIKILENIPCIIKNTALSVANSIKNSEIIMLLESNKKIDKRKSRQRESYYLGDYDLKKLIGANSMINW